MEENKDYVIEKQTEEKSISDSSMPQTISTALLEEMKELKRLIKQLTNTLEDNV